MKASAITNSNQRTSGNFMSINYPFEPFNDNCLFDAFHNKELVLINDYKFVINPLTEQIPATSAQLLAEAALRLIEIGNFDKATKIAGEEDKGGIIVAATSLLTGLPFGMARWYPSGLEGQVEIDFDSEYVSGRLYFNGIGKGDRLIIVDDLISTGGTLVSMIKALECAGAEIVDIVCVAEKLEYGGAVRVEKATGHKVKTVMKISVAGDRSAVL